MTRPRLSGFCSAAPHQPDAWQHGHCRLEGCTCDCHREQIEVPMLGQLEAPTIPGGPAVLPPPLDWPATVAGWVMTEDDKAALREHRGVTITEVAQAIAEERLHVQSTADRTEGREYVHGYADALTFAIRTIMYGKADTQRHSL